jgi:hypothetical protein
VSELPEITFAELGLLLRACPDTAELVRAALRLSADVDDEAVVAAGLSSLLARGLFERGATGELTPAEPVALVVAGLSHAGTAVSALGRWDGGYSAAYVFSGPNFRLALAPRGDGRYTPELLDPAEPVAAVLLRFADACEERGNTPVLLFRAAGMAGAALSAAVREDGSWLVSDTDADPDRSERVDAAIGRQRVAQVFDTVSAAVGP